MSFGLFLLIPFLGLATSVFEAVIPGSSPQLYGIKISKIPRGSSGNKIQVCRYFPGNENSSDCKEFPLDIGNQRAASGQSLFRGTPMEWDDFFRRCEGFKTNNNLADASVLASSFAVPGGKGFSAAAFELSGTLALNSLVRHSVRKSLEYGYRSSLRYAKSVAQRSAAGRLSMNIAGSRAFQIAQRSAAAMTDLYLFKTTMGSVYPHIDEKYVRGVRDMILPNSERLPYLLSRKASTEYIHFKDAESLLDVLSECSYGFYDSRLQQEHRKCMGGCHGSGKWKPGYR